jgi:two-component system, OmpR family, phosphate regulon sensor histidine kinase PhoR
MNEMRVLLLVLALSFLLLSAFLASLLVSLRRGIGRFVDVVKDLGASGFRRRIHMGFSSTPLKRMGTELNALLDAFQGVIEEKQRLELSHKKLIVDISHDIRTPLTSLLGYVEVLKDRELPPEERREYLEIIHAKAQSMHLIMEELFDLARLESEDTVMELTRVDLAEIVREVLASCYQDFVRASITPDIRLPEGPVVVWGNRAGIERVLANLLSNALKYGSEGGLIGVSMREEPGRVWVDVRDRGRGIPESELPRVFDRLYTTEASRNAASRGTGLGLAIARQLVMKQNGEIVAASTPGESTVFSFCLNVSPRDEP